LKKPDFHWKQDCEPQESLQRSQPRMMLERKIEKIFRGLSTPRENILV
jgi:hypothetical protein